MRTNTALEKAIEANKKHLELGHIVVLKNLTTNNYVLMVHNIFLNGVGILAIDSEKLEPCFLTVAFNELEERPRYKRIGILKDRSNIKQQIRRLTNGTK